MERRKMLRKAGALTITSSSTLTSFVCTSQGGDNDHDLEQCVSK